MLPVMLAGVYQTHLIMGLVASIPMGAFTIFVGFMIRRFFTIPYATVDKENLTVAGQVVLPSMVLPLSDIVDCEIRDDFARTLVVTLNSGKYFETHSWDLKDEDRERFVETVKERIGSG